MAKDNFLRGQHAPADPDDLIVDTELTKPVYSSEASGGRFLFMVHHKGDKVLVQVGKTSVDTRDYVQVMMEDGRTQLVTAAGMVRYWQNYRDICAVTLVDQKALPPGLVRYRWRPMTPANDWFNCVRMDRFDQHEWDLTWRIFRPLAEWVKAQKRVYIEDLACDLWTLFFRRNPAVKAPEDVPLSHEWNRLVLEQIRQLPQFLVVLDSTVNDSLKSGIATVELLKSLQLPEEMQPDQDSKSGKDGKDGKGGANTGTPADFTEDDLSDVMNKLRRAASDAMEKAAAAVDDMDAMDDLEASFKRWGDQQVGVHRVNPTARLERAAELMDNPKLREIAALAGKLSRIALHKYSHRTVRTPDEVVDLQLGADLAHLVPSELMWLLPAMNPAYFHSKFIADELLQYKLEGKESMAKGPIIVMVDESGSMSGKPDIWAKATALALLAVARLEKRSFALIHFSYGSDVRVDLYKGPEIDVFDAVEAASHFYGGGTDFNRPMHEALKLIEEESLPDADIIVVTDGEAGEIDEKILERLEVSKTDVFAVFINHLPCKPIDAITRHHICVTEFLNDIQLFDTLFP